MDTFDPPNMPKCSKFVVFYRPIVNYNYSSLVLNTENLHQPHPTPRKKSPHMPLTVEAFAFNVLLEHPHPEETTVIL